MAEAVWYVYLLQCRSGRIYTGVTPDIARRMAAHATGRGALFTRMDPPRRLLAVRPCASKGIALRLEAQVKRVPPVLKRHLAATWLQEHAVDQVAQEFPAFE